MPSLDSESISREDFDDTLLRYPDHVKEDLKELDVYRFETLPQNIEERRTKQQASKKDDAAPLLSKDELVELVTWKLKHGTFRPKLKQLVESNPEDFVNEVLHDVVAKDGTPKQKMATLTQLKGIGPATASLVLSCIWPLEYPFFSDELFRWIHWDGLNADGESAGIKSGKDWARPIGYTPKEYESLVARGKRVQERLSDGGEAVSFLDVEKVAYVLGKEKVDIGLSDVAAGVSSKTKLDSTKTKSEEPNTKKRAGAEPVQKTSRSKRAKN